MAEGSDKLLGAEKFAGAFVVELIDAVRVARSAGGMLLEHAALTAELAQSDWQEEQSRLKRLLFSILLYTLLLGLVLLHVSALVMMLAWNTPYRVHAVAGMLLIWSVALLLVRRRLQRISAEGDGRFNASREELRKTLHMLRQHL
jgi:uncharacterized membrane protein YqjE